MKTIKQIADEIGVSKQALQKRMAREPFFTVLKPYIKIENGTKYINQTGLSYIKSIYSKNASDIVNLYDKSIDNISIDNTKSIDKTTIDSVDDLGLSTGKINKISEGIDKKTIDNEKNAEKPIDNQNENVYSELLKLLREDITTLKEQLEKKDIQIADLTVIIKTQADSIAAAQQTTRAEQLLHADTKGLLSSGTDPAEPNEPKPEKKEGFFKKMFGKNK